LPRTSPSVFAALPAAAMPSTSGAVTSTGPPWIPSPPCGPRVQRRLHPGHHTNRQRPRTSRPPPHTAASHPGVDPTTPEAPMPCLPTRSGPGHSSGPRVPSPHQWSPHPGPVGVSPVQLPQQLRHRHPRGPCPQRFPRSQPGTVLDAKQGLQLPDQGSAWAALPPCSRGQPDYPAESPMRCPGPAGRGGCRTSPSGASAGALRLRQ
jgi:hypothetical protein